MSDRVWVTQAEKPGKVQKHQSNRERSSDHLFNDLSIDRAAHLARRKTRSTRKQLIPNRGGWTIDFCGNVYTPLGKKADTHYEDGKVKVWMPPVGGLGKPLRTMVAKVQLETNMIPQPHKGSVILYLDGNFDNLRLENLKWIGEEGRTQKSNSGNIAYNRMLARQAWNVADYKSGRRKAPLDIYHYFGNNVCNGHQAHNFDEGFKGNDYE